MAKFNIYAGLNGGFGGVEYIDTIEYDSYDEALDEARLRAIEIYESYEGVHGILSRDDVCEDLLESWNEEPSPEDIEERYIEEVEG